jgi:hypothetical protein
MAFNNMSPRANTLDQYINLHEDGSILRGEYDIYQRIVRDCENSPLNWFVWYDLSLPIAVLNQSEIQIDFLLICEKGAIVLEVKGGAIQVYNGRYYYDHNGRLTEMSTTPFKQAHNYKWALLQHNVLNGDLMFVDYAVAFPHQVMAYTNPNDEIDQSFWLWDKSKQDDNTQSIAQFFEEILDDVRERSAKNRYIKLLSPEALNSVVETLSPTLENKSRYAQSSLSEILKWLHLENIDILEGLSKNKRILIEGGPGTGKTTMAKAFIKKNKGLKGLYLCHNIFLAKKLEYDLVQEHLYNCTTTTYSRFLQGISTNYIDFNAINSSDIEQLLKQAPHDVYDFIIIDETQDIADKGVDVLLEDLTSSTGNGLEIGSYLIFYDLEQAYNRNYRATESVIECLMKYAAHFKLNENKRVLTNRQIIKFAEDLLSITSNDEYSHYLESLENQNVPFVNVQVADTNKLFNRLYKDALKQSEDKVNTVVLVHSNFKHIQSQDDPSLSLYDTFSCKPGIHILDERTIEIPETSSIPFTSILKYKGLEANKVILILPSRLLVGDLNNFLYEIYIGFTRAIMELQILIR